MNKWSFISCGCDESLEFLYQRTARQW